MYICAMPDVIPLLSDCAPRRSLVRLGGRLLDFI